MNATQFNTTPALILAGGFGIRLRSVESVLPKPMVLVLEQPFLFWLVKHLEKRGFREFIFSMGYKAEFIEKFSWSKAFPQSHFFFFKEKSPLGTGGAVQRIFSEYENLKKAWIINGDTLLENPLLPEQKIDDEVLYTALEPKNVFDAKPNLVTKKDRVTEVRDGGDIFDGGQVFVSRGAVEKYSKKVPCSFHELIRESFCENKVGYKIVPGTCFDIGTPARLKRFENYIKKLLS